MSTRIDGAACQIIPDDLYTSGEPSLNRLAAAAGDRFDVWQRQINRIILAKSADGFWSARNAVLSIPRQTGKTYDIGWVAIHRAARTPGMRIVWTAQHFSVIKDTFESLCAIVLRPEMSGLVDPDHGISLAAGKEEIRFRNGSRIFFRARERGALRGVKKIALLVIDEAQHLSDSAMASMLPTQNRAYNPQTIYMGTPPGPRDNGEAFTRLRDKARAGRTHSHPLRRIRRRPRRRPPRPRTMEESQPQLPVPHQRRIHRQPVGKPHRRRLPARSPRHLGRTRPQPSHRPPPMGGSHHRRAAAPAAS